MSELLKCQDGSEGKALVIRSERPLDLEPERPGYQSPSLSVLILPPQPRNVLILK